jgi:hypothetical protein
VRFYLGMTLVGRCPLGGFELVCRSLYDVRVLI